jgi:FkbM family methyltransferase
MNFLSTLYRSLLAAPYLGLAGAGKFLLSAWSNRTFHIRPKGYRHSLSVRGRTSDRMVLYSIFVEQQYPVDASDQAKHILDAGANVGYASVYFAHHFPDAQILALEPEENNFRMLEENTRCYPGIRRVKGALWKERTTLSMANPNAPSWAFQLTDQAALNGNKVPACTVADLIAEQQWPRLDLAKIDIEGAEREVFSANTAWLQNTSRLYIEVHDDQQPGSAKALFEALSGFRYQLKVAGDGFLIRLEGQKPQNAEPESAARR